MLRPSPPAFFLGCLVGMAALALLWPEPELLRPPLRLLGVAPVVGGVLLHRSATRRFRTLGTTLEPEGTPGTLVQDGIYEWTRNPMYLGGAVILLGVVALLGTLAPLLVLPIYVGAMGRGFIRAEEAVLAERFGDSYLGYQERVRRWL